MKPILFFRKLHKWLGLIIGLQILLWVAGGVVMSFFDIDEVRGEHNKAKQKPLFIEQAVAFSSSQLINSLDYSAESIILKQWQDRLVWSVQSKDQTQIFDANTGELLSPFSQEATQMVAKQDFVGDGELIQSQLITEPLSEVRGRKLPLWQHQFNDSDNTRIYVSQETGEVVARRNDTWRLFDFFWMLHIMDYKDRDNFNHPLLIIAALLALLMSLSGIYMVLKLVLFKPK
ncbi:MAG: PepSY domain-containing protein [Gammaproteobacteria bacterium]|nr:PepSY domain-containing protein [Gammaproteobacteria bacterium]